MRLLETYQHRIDAGEINDDAPQRQAIEPLDQLLDQLTAKTSRFSFRSKPAPKGIYLYGGGWGAANPWLWICSPIKPGNAASKQHDFISMTS